MAFDSEIELADIRRQRRSSRRSRRRGSRLDRFRAELVELRRAGGTLSELAIWLRRRRVKVAASTICRFLAKLPELVGGTGDAQF